MRPKLIKISLITLILFGLVIPNVSLRQAENLVSASELDLISNLVAYYKFDGTYEDASDNGNNGLPNGKVDFISGKIGQALKLYGIFGPGGASNPG